MVITAQEVIQGSLQGVFVWFYWYRPLCYWWLSAGCFGHWPLWPCMLCIFIVDCYHFSLLTLCVPIFMPRLSSLFINVFQSTFVSTPQSQTPYSQVRVWVWWTGTKWSLMLSVGRGAPLLKLSPLQSVKCKEKFIADGRWRASSLMNLFPHHLNFHLFCLRI